MCKLCESHLVSSKIWFIQCVSALFGFGNLTLFILVLFGGFSKWDVVENSLERMLERSNPIILDWTQFEFENERYLEASLERGTFNPHQLFQEFPLITAQHKTVETHQYIVLSLIHSFEKFQVFDLIVLWFFKIPVIESLAKSHFGKRIDRNFVSLTSLTSALYFSTLSTTVDINSTFQTIKNQLKTHNITIEGSLVSLSHTHTIPFLYSYFVTKFKYFVQNLKFYYWGTLIFSFTFFNFVLFEILEETIDLIVGYVHALNGNLDFAKNYFLKSINEILKSQPLNVQQLWALIANLLELPRFYRLNGDFKASIECIRNVIELWKKWNQGQHNFSKFLVVVNFSLFQFSHLSCLVLSC